MPELTIKIGDDPNPLGFRDGDIIHAWNDAHLLLQHTWRIVDHRKLGGGFYKPKSSLAYKCQRALSKWMIERDFPGRKTQEEILVTNLVTGETEVKSDIRNANGNRINLSMYLDRREAAGTRAIFGSRVTAVWFEGRREITMARLHTLWAEHITPREGLVMAGHLKREYGASHLKKHLVIITNDFSDARRDYLEEALVEEFDNAGFDPDDPGYRDPVMRRQRKRYIDWRNIPGMSGGTIDEILDRRRVIAVRRDLIRDETTLARERS